MSIFSDNITSVVKINDVYNFMSVETDAESEIDALNALNFSISNTFSKIKISKYINEHNIQDGKLVIDRHTMDNFKSWFKERFRALDLTFVGLIWVLMLSDGLEDKYLENIYNSLINDFSYKNGSRVGIKISKGVYTKIKFWVRGNKVKNRFSFLLLPKNSRFENFLKAFSIVY